MTSINLDLDVKGIQQKLDSLESELKGKAVRAGLVSFAKPIKKTAKQLAPKDKGDLADAIGHRALTRRQAARIDLFEGGSGRTTVDNTEVAVLVGPNRKVKGRNQAFKGTVIEFGTKKKWRNYRNRRLRHLPGYKHSGTQGTFFMKRALEQNQSQAEPLFYKGVATYLKRIDK